MPSWRLSGSAGLGGSVTHGTCVTWMPCILSAQGRGSIPSIEQWTSLTPSKLCNTTRQKPNKPNKLNKQNKLNKLSKQTYQLSTQR